MNYETCDSIVQNLFAKSDELYERYLISKGCDRNDPINYGRHVSVCYDSQFSVFRNKQLVLVEAVKSMVRLLFSDLDLNTDDLFIRKFNHAVLVNHYFEIAIDSGFDAKGDCKYFDHDSDKFCDTIFRLSALDNFNLLDVEAKSLVNKMNSLYKTIHKKINQHHIDCPLSIVYGVSDSTILEMVIDSLVSIIEDDPDIEPIEVLFWMNQELDRKRKYGLSRQFSIRYEQLLCRVFYIYRNGINGCVNFTIDWDVNTDIDMIYGGYNNEIS